MNLDKNLTRSDVTITETKTVFSGFFKIKRYLLTHRLFGGGTSKPITRELFCRGLSVGVLLYDPASDRVGLVRQFRIGCLENETGPWVWEVIAGVNDKQEAAEQVAVREVMEESGLQVYTEDLLPICNYYSSPGGSDERLQLYCAITSLAAMENISGLAEESEDILFKTMPCVEAIGAMLKGTINNAATIIALQWLELNRADLQKRHRPAP